MLTDAPAAYLLAGGRSTRFGSDKARADWGGATLLESNAALLRRAGMQVTVVASEPDAYADLGLRTIGDTIAGAGPLGGIDAALRDCAPAEDIVVMACDLAAVREGWIQTLWNARNSGSHAVVFDSVFAQPLLGCYSRALLPALEAALAEKRFGVMRFLKTQPVLCLPAPAGWEALRNLNEASDWTRALEEGTEGP